MGSFHIAMKKQLIEFLKNIGNQLLKINRNLNEKLRGAKELGLYLNNDNIDSIIYNLIILILIVLSQGKIDCFIIIFILDFTFSNTTFFCHIFIYVFGVNIVN